MPSRATCLGNAQGGDREEGKTMTDQASSYRWIEGQGPAFGWPGVEPRWTSSKKDAVGMAYSASSRIWYTVSHGILNEIYYPTIDRPQTRDMEFLLTDGETFVHEEKRDLERTFEYIDALFIGRAADQFRSPGPLQDHQGDHRRSPSSGGADAGASGRRRAGCFRG